MNTLIIFETKNVRMTQHGVDSSTACNIGNKGQQRRRMIGIFLLALAGMLSGFFIAWHASLPLRLLVFPFFAGGFIALLESQQKVCVLNAYTGKVEE
jgi:hypothetical protein